MRERESARWCAAAVVESMFCLQHFWSRLLDQTRSDGVFGSRTKENACLTGWWLFSYEQTIATWVCAPCEGMQTLASATQGSGTRHHQYKNAESVGEFWSSRGRRTSRVRRGASSTVRSGPSGEAERGWEWRGRVPKPSLKKRGSFWRILRRKF